LWVVPQNRWREDGTGHASRSAGLLHLKQVTLEFSSLASRLAEAQRRVVHVASSWRLHQDQVKDGWVDAMGNVGPCYPYFTVFYTLGPRGIIVF
jgi:hypothetical protein